MHRLLANQQLARLRSRENSAEEHGEVLLPAVHLVVLQEFQQQRERRLREKRRTQVRWILERVFYQILPATVLDGTRKCYQTIIEYTFHFYFLKLLLSLFKIGSLFRFAVANSIVVFEVLIYDFFESFIIIDGENKLNVFSRIDNTEFDTLCYLFSLENSKSCIMKDDFKLFQENFCQILFRNLTQLYKRILSSFSF